MKRALITGVTGQDGSYLAELLLSKGYEVHGVVRRSSSFNTSRIDHLYADPHEVGTQLRLHYGDLNDTASLLTIVERTQPDEVYNLAAQSHVRVSFDIPEYTADITGVGTMRLLEAIRKIDASCRFYQASSSELFGQAVETPQNERTPFRPRSPYGVAKAFGFYTAASYREAYGLYAVNGILFNHESERRGETFVTRKITRAVGRIKHGIQRQLFLGNLDARRDWGHAEDYVEAMWRMLQQERADDYVVGSGESHSVREFLDLAFGRVGLDWRDFVQVDPRYFRPAEVDALRADATKAKRELGWQPRVAFGDLVRRMVDYDVELAAREKSMAG